MKFARKMLDKLFTKQEKEEFLDFYYKFSKEDEKEDYCGFYQEYQKIKSELIEMEDKFFGYNNNYEFDDMKVEQMIDNLLAIQEAMCAKIYKYAYKKGKKDSFINLLFKK